MAYFVTFTDAGIGALDDGTFDLRAAFAHACSLLSEGKVDVAINDDLGRNIRGDELALCCRGEKKLTEDLRAV
jgi:hypothetical protein